jgi:UDP-N-acetylglucosamine--N-acetylmuramyl-(pentapeptide) pyrophosphoryl-undecaprenol N-acetylglucosamine transferase
MSNKLLAPIADRVYMGLPLQEWPLGFEDAECVGNPLRRQLQRGVYLPSTTGALRVLILGGSQGASFLNATLPAVCTGWQWKDQLEIWHQTGNSDHEQVHEAYHAAKVNARVDSFIYDMATAYAWADVVIARAGAMTVSEITQVAKPALFIPYPFAVDNHQQANAESLVEMGAAWMVVQSKASMDVLRYQLSEWLQHPRLLDNARQALLSQADNQAGQVIAEALLALAEAKNA